MEFSLNSIQIKFQLTAELPTRRHSRNIKDIVETLTWDAATLSKFRVDPFEYLRVPVETFLKCSQCGRRLQETDVTALRQLGSYL